MASIPIYVSSGEMTSPYYTFYYDSNGDHEVLPTNTLYLNQSYIFYRLNDATSHPFYITDTDSTSVSSTNIVLSGDGDYQSGITGSESVELSFNGLSTSDTLYFYCTSHPSVMMDTFTLVDYNSHIHLYVGDSSTTYPYYTFYTDASATQELVPTHTLYLNHTYTFHRLVDASNSESIVNNIFYISDQGHKSSSSIINIIATTTFSDAILAGESMTIEFGALTTSDILYYYNTD